MMLNKPREVNFKIHGFGSGIALNVRIYCQQLSIQDSSILSLLFNAYSYLTSKLHLDSDHVYVKATDKTENYYFKMKELGKEWQEIRQYLQNALVIIYSETDLRYHKKAQMFLMKPGRIDSGMQEVGLLKRKTTLFRSNSLLITKSDIKHSIKNDVLAIKDNESSGDSTKSFEAKKDYLTKDIISTMSTNKRSNDPYVYSNDRTRAPFSFLGRKGDNVVLASPIYLASEMIKIKFNNVKTCNVSDSLWTNYKATPTGELVLFNQVVLDAEKGVLKEVLGNRLSSLFGNEPNAGLPIRIFKPHSQLEAISNLFMNLEFLHKAYTVNDKLERFKYVITYVFSNISYGISPWKPFTPYLGETLQGKFNDGTEIFLEHFHHKPFMDAILIVNEESCFKVSGNIESTSDDSANRVIVIFKGTLLIEIDGDKFYFSLPSIVNEGFSYTKRTVSLIDNFCFYAPQYEMKALINVGVNGKINYSEGGIYKVQQPINPMTKNFEKALFRNGKPDSKDVVVSVINGCWFERLMFDKVEFWNNTMPSLKLLLKHDVLPSDWRFREDILWLMYEKPDLSLAWKLRMEEIQRDFRAQREKYYNSHRKMFKNA